MVDPTTSFTVVAGRSNHGFAEAVASHLGTTLAQVEIYNFSDGEIFAKYVENIRGHDLFIIQPTFPPADNLMELLILIDAAKRASAHRITAVIPYFGYARQDRKDQPRVPITAKLTANLLITAGVDRILTMDLHSPQIQGFFDIPLDHLYSSPVLTEHWKKQLTSDAVIVSPDVGGVKLARAYAKRLQADFAIIDKRRPRANSVEVMNIIGDVEGRDVLMIDDMIATAGTVCEAAKIVRERGARSVRAAATHAVLAGPAVERLAAANLNEVAVGDTIPVPSEIRAKIPNFRTLSVAELLGEAIARIHKHQSVSSLFNKS